MAQFSYPFATRTTSAGIDRLTRREEPLRNGGFNCNGPTRPTVYMTAGRGAAARVRRGNKICSFCCGSGADFKVTGGLAEFVYPLVIYRAISPTRILVFF